MLVKEVSSILKKEVHVSKFSTSFTVLVKEVRGYNILFLNSQGKGTHIMKIDKFTNGTCGSYMYM